jgi:hypothetical protein
MMEQDDQEEDGEDACEQPVTHAVIETYFLEVVLQHAT